MGVLRIFVCVCVCVCVCAGVDVFDAHLFLIHFLFQCGPRDID